MRYTGKELKCRAREAMKGNYLVPVLAAVVVALLAFSANCIVMLLFQGNSTLSLALSQLASLICSLILSVFTAVICSMYLNIARKRSYSIQDIFSMFHQDPDRIIVVCFVLTLINMLCSIPLYMVQGLLVQADTPEKLLEVFPVVFGATCLSAVLSLFVTLPFAFSYMLLVDDPQMGAGGALRGSVSMLKGNKMRLCRLYISFFGMGVLVALSGFVAYIWVEAYMQATMVQLYMELNGEFEKASQTEGPVESERGGLPIRADDRNAEA